MKSAKGFDLQDKTRISSLTGIQFIICYFNTLTPCLGFTTLSNITDFPPLNVGLSSSFNLPVSYFDKLLTYHSLLQTYIHTEPDRSWGYDGLCCHQAVKHVEILRGKQLGRPEKKQNDRIMMELGELL
jgi:hypothetical protein